MNHDARELPLPVSNPSFDFSAPDWLCNSAAGTGRWLIDEPEVANDQLDDSWNEELDPLEALASGMPALDQALGSWLFDQLAEDYLDARGETEIPLHQLAEGFAAYLELSRPDHDLPCEEREPWGDFVVELATFEASWLRISQDCEVAGARTPDESAISRAAVQGPWRKVGTWHFALAPRLALHRFRFPVDEYWRAVRRGEHPAEPEPRPTHLLIEGRDGLARVRRLGGNAHRMLAALERGSTLEEARQASALRIATFRSLFGRWIDRGWVGASPRPVLRRQLGG